jgi:hypothetical protein
MIERHESGVKSISDAEGSSSAPAGGTQVSELSWEKWQD